MITRPVRAMMIGAHPDDCDLSTCAVTLKLKEKGCVVHFVSVTTGNAGHQTIKRKELAEIRAKEAQACAKLFNITYEILGFDDGLLTPSLEAREAVMRSIRRFKPDLLFTNRINDYHPDHRATAQLVQDCSYLLGVPAVCPDTPPMRTVPTILYWYDSFTEPTPFRPDLAISADFAQETAFKAECCHASQYLDWLPWIDDKVDLAGKTHEERLAYARHHLEERKAEVDDAVRKKLTEEYGAEFASKVKFAESWQVSEYGAPLSEKLKKLLID